MDRRDFIVGVTAVTTVLTGCLDSENDAGDGSDDNENQDTSLDPDESQTVYNDSLNESDTFSFDASADDLIEIEFVNAGQETTEIEINSPEEEPILTETVEQTAEVADVEEIYQINATTSGTYSVSVTVPDGGFAHVRVWVEE